MDSTSFLALFEGRGGPHDVGICRRHPENVQEWEFFPGHHCSMARRQEFYDNAPAGFSLYGVTVVGELPGFILASPDDRLFVVKEEVKVRVGRMQGTAAGWAKPGELPHKAALREGFQEICLWLDDRGLSDKDEGFGQRVQIVPQGMKPRTKVPMLNRKLTGHRVVGKLELVGVNYYDDRKQIEFIFRWDLRPFLSDAEMSRFRAVWTEQIDGEGCFVGTPYLRIDPLTGLPLGSFQGIQFPLDFHGLAGLGKPAHHHEPLAKYLTEIRPLLAAA